MARWKQLIIKWNANSLESLFEEEGEEEEEHKIVRTSTNSGDIHTNTNTNNDNESIKTYPQRALVPPPATLVATSYQPATAGLTEDQHHEVQVMDDRDEANIVDYTTPKNTIIEKVKTFM